MTEQTTPAPELDVEAIAPLPFTAEERKAFVDICFTAMRRNSEFQKARIHLSFEDLRNMSAALANLMLRWQAERAPRKERAEIIAYEESLRSAREEIERLKAKLSDETVSHGYTLGKLGTEIELGVEAREEIERLKEYLRTCDSALQLCSERIASDRVAFEAMIKALPNVTPAMERARKDQNGIDRYVFKVIDDARKLARSP